MIIKALRKLCFQKPKTNEWGFSNKMLDLTRHIDSVRKA